MKSKILHYIILSIASVVLFAAISYLRAFDFRLNFVVAAIYGVAIYYFSRLKYEKHLIPLFIFFAPHLIVLIAFFFLMGEDKLYTALPSLFAPIISALVAHMLWNKSILHRTLGYTAYLLFCFAVVIWVMPKIGSWHTYGTFTGEIEAVSLSKSHLTNDDGSAFEFSGKGNTYLLDFWHSKCGVCFKEFPKF